MMTPKQKYQQDIDQELVSDDATQRRVLESFDRLQGALVEQSTESSVSASFLDTLLKRDDASGNIKGIYLWGGVGRGKTYLMDLFYECLPFEQKSRTHFHRFMQSVHSQLTELQGQPNPLDSIAKRIAKHSKIVCFDEFFVLDIGDAMLLAGLLKAFFENDITLVTTSNICPDGLYENGLQRASFLPAIELIKENTEVIHMDSVNDYRLRNLRKATLYHFPIDDQTDTTLVKEFYDLAPDKGEIRQQESIEILGRQIETRYYEDDVVWFEFSALCAGPRSAFDYVEIARLFHAIILSEVPQLNEASEDQARRFVSLIDELYDRRVKLIISAQTSIEELYSGEKLTFEFERTRSRLIEMQSLDYLGSQHRA